MTAHPTKHVTKYSGAPRSSRPTNEVAIGMAFTFCGYAKDSSQAQNDKRAINNALNKDRH